MKQKVFYVTLLVVTVVAVFNVGSLFIKQDVKKSNATEVTTKSNIAIEKFEDELNSQSDYEVKINGYDEQSKLYDYTISDNDEVKSEGSASKEYLEEVISNFQ